MSPCNEIGGNESRSEIPYPDSSQRKGNKYRILITVIIVIVVVVVASIVALLFIRNHWRKRLQPLILSKQENSKNSVDFRESQSIDVTSDFKKGGDGALNFVREEKMTRGRRREGAPNFVPQMRSEL